MIISVLYGGKIMNYKPNDNVFHKMFGKGKIIRTYMDNRNISLLCDVKFDSLDTIRTIISDCKNMRIN